MAAKIKEKKEASEIEQTGPIVDDTFNIKKVKRKKRSFTRFIPILIILLLLVGLASVIIFDVFSLRSNYLDGILQNIPIVKNIISVEDKIEGEYAGWTTQQLVDEIGALKNKMAMNEDDIQSLSQKSDMYVKEISRLQEFEDMQVSYKENKAEFDRLIASEDSKSYASFYETLSPENAEILYKEAVLENRDIKRLKEYARTFESMDELETADILSQMMGTDINLVVLIANNLSAETRGAVLGKMTPSDAAILTKMMAPEFE